MPEAMYLRLIETVDKAAGLAELTRRPDRRSFRVDSGVFGNVPGSPMAYWISPDVLRCFTDLPALDGNESIVRSTNPLNQDFRFARLAWEVNARSLGGRWRPWAKGGSFSRFYYDIETVISWSKRRSSYFDFLGTENRPLERPASVQHFFRPGITWPRRTDGLSFRVLPEDCIFGDKGPAAFIADDRYVALLALSAVLNSAPFAALVALQLARTELAQSYEVGIIQRTPIPKLSADDESTLSTLAHIAWSLKRSLNTITENSHAFTLPALLRAIGTLRERDTAWTALVRTNEQSLTTIQAEIDDRCFALYGIDAVDRASIERGFGLTHDEGDYEQEPDDDVDIGGDTVGELLSWSIGAAFGRFDVRLAMGERPIPPEPAPFAALPPCSSGMLTGPDGLPEADSPVGYPLDFPTDGLLVDDPGADRDLLARVRQVFEVVFGADADDRLREATELLDNRSDDLRRWLRSIFFPEHIQRYSKSRRKAPIYWRLGTPSGSYSVWLYIHRAGPDTLHAVLRDHVEPKLRFETNRLAALQSEAGESPAPSQRKATDAQQVFVDELANLRDELRRIAPLWNPDLDDGVVINASFLHRLFAHTRAWQKTCEEHWRALQAGDYDWAHLALRLWPERVVPKCAVDRSLAIAHGLEGALWFEDADKRWKPREVSEEALEALTAQRTSPAVKDALAQLGSAPAPQKTRAPRAIAAPTRTPERRPPDPKNAQLSLGMRAATVDVAALDALREALLRFPDGAGKAELLTSTGMSEAVWKPAIEALIESGEVMRTGQKRGTRYALARGGQDA